jgi:hypothetical protein
MPDFQPHTLEVAACREQVQELKDLLDSSADLGEAAFHNFFEPRSHLRALVGLYNPSLLSPDRLAWQYPIFGPASGPVSRWSAWASYWSMARITPDWSRSRRRWSNFFWRLIRPMGSNGPKI